jgi:hypothetical protein
MRAAEREVQNTRDNVVGGLKNDNVTAASPRIAINYKTLFLPRIPTI